MVQTSSRSTYSLQSRLLVAFSILLFGFLGLTGLVLDSAFRASIEGGAQERLQVQIYLLLANAEEDNGEFYFLQDLQEPRFGQLNSGLYGFISSTAYGILWRSNSARAFTPPENEYFQRRLEVGESRFERLVDSEQEVYFALSYGILWENGIDEFAFSVIENAAPYYSEISNFRTSLWYWLGGAAVILLVMQFLLLRWGLLPLRLIANDLKQIESGKEDKLEGVYPREIQGVTDNLNLLIESERRQQSRYRTTLGDLAHSLKTPLAVISGILPNLSSEVDKGDVEAVRKQIHNVDEQLERMTQIVTYQLQRAVQSNDKGTLAKHVNLSSTLNKVLDALKKVYVDKQVQVTASLDNQVIFHGDERDLLELLGNVLDNAFKYGHGIVRVTTRRTDTASRGVSIEIEDNGKGIPEEKQEFVLQRGARADTLVQGHGIGLAVVTDIVKSYGGQIEVGRSELGGAKLSILLHSIV